MKHRFAHEVLAWFDQCKSVQEATRSLHKQQELACFGFTVVRLTLRVMAGMNRPLYDWLSAISACPVKSAFAMRGRGG